MVLSDFLLQILTALALSVFIGGFTAFVFALIRFLKAKAERTETLLDDKVIDFIERFAIVAVQAAEQLGISNQILDEAKVKRAYAINSVQNNLNSLGVKGIDAGLIADFVEAAVRQAVHKDYVTVSTVVNTSDGDFDDDDVPHDCLLKKGI